MQNNQNERIISDPMGCPEWRARVDGVESIALDDIIPYAEALIARAKGLGIDTTLPFEQVFNEVFDKEKIQKASHCLCFKDYPTCPTGRIWKKATERDEEDGHG